MREILFVFASEVGQLAYFGMFFPSVYGSIFLCFKSVCDFWSGEGYNHLQATMEKTLHDDR